MSHILAALAFGLSIGVAVIPAQMAAAATQTVTNCNDSGSGSLRQALADAGSGDTIAFALSPPCSTIALSSTIDIATSVDIKGPGASTLAVNGTMGTSDRPVFQVASGVTAAISGLTIADGQADGGSGTGGGGINNDGTLTLNQTAVTGNAAANAGAGIYNGGTLTVMDSTVSDNNLLTTRTFDFGGGIYNDGSLSLLDSTVSGNSAQSFGGGLFNDTAGTVTIVDSTFSDNLGSDAGGAIFNLGTLQVTASDFVGNTSYGGASGIQNSGGSQSLAATILDDYTWGFDCSVSNSGTNVDAGFNIDDDDSCGFSSADHSQSGIDPDIGPLQNNGGPTETEAPYSDSPALDQIPTGTTGNGLTLCPGTDQRGDSRPAGRECDIGAVELTGPPDERTAQTITFTSSSPSNAVAGGPTYAVTAIGGGSDNPVIFTINAASTSVCSLTGNGSITESTVEFNGPGTCALEADQAGDESYIEAPQVQQSFTVREAPSTPMITNIPPSGAAVLGGSFVPTVNTTGDGATSVTSSTTSVCSVSSVTVSYFDVGTCTLTAHVAVGNTYGAADGSPESFSVSPQPQAITSPSTASTQVGASFSFTVTTSGAPVVPTMVEKGKPPKHLSFVDNGNGTATLSGIPARKGVYHMTIKATFGTGKSRNVVTQRFTLTVSKS